MKIKTKLGVFHLHNIENDYEIWQVCDSDDEFIANLYGESSLKHFLKNITTLNDITELCDIGGLVDNITWGLSKRSASIAVLDYIQEEKYNWDNEEWDYTEEDIEAMSEYVNRVGDNYFIVDYTEL